MLFGQTAMPGGSITLWALIAGLVLALIVLWKGERLTAPLSRPGGIAKGFLIWAAIVLFEFYAFGSSSFIYMNNDGDDCVPFYNYLAQFHSGGQFAHAIGHGADVKWAFVIGGQAVMPEALLLSLLPTWLAVLAHKGLLLTLGFIGTYLLTRDKAKCSRESAFALACLFTVSSFEIINVTYSLGGIALIPLATYVAVARSDRPGYWLPVMAVAALVGLFATPTHTIFTFPVAFALCLLLVGGRFWRAFGALIVMGATLALNWAEAIWAKLQWAPYTMRGMLPPLPETWPSAFEIMKQVLLRAFPVAHPFHGALLVLALAALAYRRDRLAVKAVAIFLGTEVVLQVVFRIPWRVVGLGMLERLSLEYAWIGIGTAIVLLAGIAAARVESSPRAAILGRSPAIVLLALACVSMTWLKVMDLNFLFRNGGQTHYHTVRNLARPDWKSDEPARIITLRSYYRGIEPNLPFGFYGLESADGFVNLPSRQWAHFMAALRRSDSADLFDSEDPRYMIDWAFWDPETSQYRVDRQLVLDLLRVANIGYIASPLPLSGEGLILVSGPDRIPLLVAKNASGAERRAKIVEQFDRVFEFGKIYVYRVENALPRLFAAQGLSVLADNAGPRDILAEVERAAPGRLIVATDSTAKNLGPAAPDLRVKDFRLVPDAVEADIEAPNGGVLVYNVPWMPFWSAEADGRPLEIHSVNAVAMAVSVPPGSQRVAFRYHRQTIVEKLARIVQ